MADTIRRSLSLENDEKELAAFPEPILPAEKHSWFRSPLFQIHVVGFCAFLAPGLWNAMASLGAGGGQSPFLANAANSILFVLMTITCLLGSAITNRISYRWALVLGTTGYAVYAGGLVLYSNAGVDWLIYLGAATCGLSAGVFWCVEGAIALGYPEPEKRGFYLALWLGWRNAGSILGGAIVLGTNLKGNQTGTIGATTYYVFIALQAIAPAVAVFLSNPQQVRRSDGSGVQMAEHIGVANELRQMWQIVKRPEVAWLIPASLYAQFSSPYINSFFAVYFSVRARALGSLIMAILGVIVNFMMGWFLDWQRLSLKTRARATYLVIWTWLGATWVWSLILQTRYDKHSPPALDWASSESGREFSVAFALYLVYYMAFFLLQNILYFQISHLARNPPEILRLSAALRGLESAGSAVGYGLSAVESWSLLVPLIINTVTWGIAMVAGWFSVRVIGTSKLLDLQHGFGGAKEKEDSAK